MTAFGIVLAALLVTAAVAASVRSWLRARAVIAQTENEYRPTLVTWAEAGIEIPEDWKEHQ